VNSHHVCIFWGRVRRPLLTACATRCTEPSGCGGHTGLSLRTLPDVDGLLDRGPCHGEGPLNEEGQAAILAVSDVHELGVDLDPLAGGSFLNSPLGGVLIDDLEKR
jgi:hypothetical protein